ncbi:MAG: hypothetical protein OEW75_05910 [Cyclobacteriaceae bacterium]|nr:hypothetical protein [Cyclobacteriaceae bacterium]
MFKKNTIAFCPLSSSKNTSSYISVTPDYIILMEDQRELNINLDDAHSISTESRVILLPTLLGGIVCPLSFIAISKGSGDPWVLFFLAFLGLMAIYKGLSGQDYIIVKDRIKEYSFFIHDTHPHLQRFIKFCSLFIKNKNLENTLILALKNNEWFETELNEYIKLDKGKKIFLENVPPHEIQNNPDTLYLYITNPLKYELKLYLKPSTTGDFSPILEGIIPANALKKYL